MKYKDEDPDNLGGLGDLLPAEVLKMLNQLLERTHQAEGNKQGSKIEFVYVASGGQHVETQINVETHPQPLPIGRGVDTFKGEGNTKGERSTLSALPEALATDKAMVLWKKAQKAGWVDDNYQPLISRTQAALLADAMAERLGIREKWKVFEALWNRKYMRSDYNLALTRKLSLDFQDELKSVFAQI